jgi:hypothetical protein
MSNSFTYSNPGVIEISTQGGKPPCLDNWKNDTYLKLEADKMSFSTSQWNFATARATVCVTQGRWYYEMSIKTTGQARVGWASQNYAPESNYSLVEVIKIHGDGMVPNKKLTLMKKKIQLEKLMENIGT